MISKENKLNSIGSARKPSWIMARTSRLELLKTMLFAYLKDIVFGTLIKYIHFFPAPTAAFWLNTFFLSNSPLHPFSSSFVTFSYALTFLQTSHKTIFHIATTLSLVLFMIISSLNIHFQIKSNKKKYLNQSTSLPLSNFYSYCLSNSPVKNSSLSAMTWIIHLCFTVIYWCIIYFQVLWC